MKLLTEAEGCGGIVGEAEGRSYIFELLKRIYGDAIQLEFTLIWIVATMCSVFVSISLFVECFLHYLGKV